MADSTEKPKPKPPFEITKPTGPARAKVYIAPNKVDWDNILGKSVFLAGSIEQDTAPKWQEEFTRRIQHIECTIFNPRREGWDPKWEQRMRNPQFKEQVDWELDCQDKANVIAMYFDQDSKSPITLLELGLYASQGTLIVCCPEKFYRLGNVEVVCDRFNIQLVDSFDKLVAEVKKKLEGEEDPKEQDETEGKREGAKEKREGWDGGKDAKGPVGRSNKNGQRGVSGVTSMMRRIFPCGSQFSKLSSD